MTEDLAEKYAAPVPRYTSYPTAPHFHPGIGAESYGRWLAERPAETALSLYLHIPFCDSLCWFCGCHTKVVNRYGPIAQYLGLLGREIDLIADRLAGRRPVSHLHWGGGTPTILTPDDIEALTARLRRRFALLPDAEFGVEIDPRGLDRARVAALARAGCRRASLGVQDVNPEVQRAVNRLQPLEETRRAVDWLRAEGIDEINIDLMYGLPHQTVERVLTTVERVLTLAPGRIALFGYAHVPWMRRHQRLIDAAALPSPALRARQRDAAAGRLVEAGYRRIGLDHFARPEDPLARAQAAGRLRRNFQGYTTDEATALIGFGVSAIGALPQGYVQNAADLPSYRRALEAGRPAVVRGIALDDDDRLRRAVIERLMCDLEVDLGPLTRRFGRAPESLGPELAALAPMAADGLVALDGFRLRVEERGRPLLRSVSAVFDAYLGTGAARHSVAV